MPTLSNPANTEIPYNNNITHVVEEVKTTQVGSRLFFALNGVLENRKCVLESPSIFCSKEGTSPVFKDC